MYIIKMETTQTTKLLEQSKPQTPIQESYIKSLDDKERVAYKIAASYLQTSFDLERSLGFKKYQKNNTQH